MMNAAAATFAEGKDSKKSKCPHKIHEAECLCHREERQRLKEAERHKRGQLAARLAEMLPFLYASTKHCLCQ